MFPCLRYIVLFNIASSYKWIHVNCSHSSTDHGIIYLFGYVFNVDDFSTIKDYYSYLIAFFYTYSVTVK